MKIESKSNQILNLQEGMPFEFGYGVQDHYTGNDFSHNSESDGNVVNGEYRVLLPDGRTQIVTYTADGYNGYKAEVTYEGEARPYEAPKQSYKQPEPAYSAPKPAYSAPKPKPTYNAPKPQPTYSAPKPKPQPTYSAPKPTYQQPEPIYTAPVPVYQQPKRTYGADF